MRWTRAKFLDDVFFSLFILLYSTAFRDRYPGTWCIQLTSTYVLLGVWWCDTLVITILKVSLQLFYTI
jgi:hypothetical protein